jgi:hypothetical protein
MAIDFYTGNTDLNIYPFNFTDNSCVRFTNKTNTSNERSLYNNYWREQLNLYGINVDYYVNNFTTLSADNLYGEQPTQQYSYPQPILMGITLAENALMLSKYGLMADDEVTAFIHISSFQVTFGNGAEPKSGDLFRLTEYGSDRPGGRAGNFYEITQRVDQDISQINTLQGHYVWLLKAKRFEYSFEPGLSGGEAVNQQVFEDTTSSTASGATKNYTYNVDVAGKKVFDYTATSNYDSVYGGY